VRPNPTRSGPLSPRSKATPGRATPPSGATPGTTRRSVRGTACCRWSCPANAPPRTAGRSSRRSGGAPPAGPTCWSPATRTPLTPRRSRRPARNGRPCPNVLAPAARPSPSGSCRRGCATRRYARGGGRGVPRACRGRWCSGWRVCRRCCWVGPRRAGRSTPPSPRGTTARAGGKTAASTARPTGSPEIQPRMRRRLIASGVATTSGGRCERRRSKARRGVNSHARRRWRPGWPTMSGPSGNGRPTPPNLVIAVCNFLKPRGRRSRGLGVRG
jgi:hypothetical protein